MGLIVLFFIICECLLTCAVLGNKLALCEKLLELGADINFVNSKNQNLIHIFLKNVTCLNPKILEFLVKNGCNLEHKDSYGNTPLLYSVKYLYNIKCVKILLKYGANVFETDIFDQKPSSLVGPKNYGNIYNIYLYNLLIQKEEKYLAGYTNIYNINLYNLLIQKEEEYLAGFKRAHLEEEDCDDESDASASEDEPDPEEIVEEEDDNLDM